MAVELLQYLATDFFLEMCFPRKVDTLRFISLFFAPLLPSNLRAHLGSLGPRRHEEAGGGGEEWAGMEWRETESEKETISAYYKRNLLSNLLRSFLSPFYRYQVPDKRRKT